MSEEPYKILSRQEMRVSPWVTVVSKDVEMAPGKKTETYHCFAQADYVMVLARTKSGKVPIVGQFRPAVEEFTWELPSGLLEKDETPEACCRRELFEEAGVNTEKVFFLGSYYADTGRLENQVHAFYAEVSDPAPDFKAEEGLTVEYVTPETIRAYILSGTLCHQLNLGVFTLAAVRGFLKE